MQISWHSEFKPSIWQRWNAQTQHIHKQHENTEVKQETKNDKDCQGGQYQFKLLLIGLP